MYDPKAIRDFQKTDQIFFVDQILEKCKAPEALFFKFHLRNEVNNLRLCIIWKLNHSFQMKICDR